MSTTTKETKKPYVRIASNTTITVTAGLQCLDATNVKSDIPNRLKVAPMWAKLTIDIKKGSFVYPSEILEWNTVKALAKEKVITIGELLDSPEDNADKTKEVLVNNINDVNKRIQAGKKTLDQIAGD